MRRVPFAPAHAQRLTVMADSCRSAASLSCSCKLVVVRALGPPRHGWFFLLLVVGLASLPPPGRPRRIPTGASR